MRVDTLYLKDVVEILDRERRRERTKKREVARDRESDQGRDVYVVDEFSGELGFEIIETKFNRPSVKEKFE